MRLQLSEDFLLDEQVELSFEELVALSGLSAAELGELVESGALLPIHPQATPWTFAGHHVVTVRSVCRLRDDFDLDANALPLAHLLLVRIRELESQLRELQARVPTIYLTDQ